MRLTTWCFSTFLWWCGAAFAEPSSLPEGVVGWRTDAIGVRLSPRAAQLAARGHEGRPAPGGFRSNLGIPSIDAIARAVGVLRFEHEFPGVVPLDAAGPILTPSPLSSALEGFWIVHLPPRSAVEPVIAAFRAAPEVETAYPIAIVRALAVPNDSAWASSYYFHQASGRDLDAVPAWDLTRGDSSIVVAITDTGVFPNHPDLEGQIWSNRAERIGAPGVDDDGNGFVDDFWGWDFVDMRDSTRVRESEDGRDPDNDPNDFAGHGTAVASVVAARTNNHIGVAGAAWHARLMPLRIGWSSPTYPSGEGDVSAIARAIDYATRTGASIINCSFTTAEQPDLVAAVDAALHAGVTIVTAAGNLGTIHYLAQRPDVLSVAATDADDRITSWSTTRGYVDLAAPGNRIAAATIDRVGTDSLTLRQPFYTQASGTSFSSPLVAGGAALIQSWRREHGEPPLRPMDVMLRLTETTDDIGDVNPGITGYGSGRLNLLAALSDTSGSRVAKTRARLAGPGVVLPTEVPPWRIVLPTLDRRLIEIEGAHGTVRRTIPLSGVPAGGVAAADLGWSLGPGLFVATTDGRLHGFGIDGAPLPGWPVATTVATTAMAREPVLGDLDGDGRLEILWSGGRDGRVWAWRLDGAPVPGFPRLVTAGDLAIAVDDLDGNPGAEIAVVSRAGTAMVLNGDGETRSAWPVQLLSGQWPPAIGRFGKRRQAAVLFSGNIGVWAMTADGGTLWQVTMPGTALGPPALADLDGDNGDEVVLLRFANEPIAVLDSAGTSIRAWQSRLVEGAATSPLLVAPVTSGGAPGVLAPVFSSGIVGFDAGARRLRGHPKPGVAISHPTCGDFDGDGRTEILAASDSDSMLYLYDAGPGTWRDDGRGWLTARGGSSRSGSRTGPRIAPLDGRAPRTIARLSATTQDANAILSWAAPYDDRGVVLYEITRTCTRRAGRPAAETVVDTLTPRAATGETETYVSRDVDENSSYAFRVRSRDASGNWSLPSGEFLIDTPARRPGLVSDLRVLSTRDSSVLFAWTATGDDAGSGRPRIYRLRAAEFGAETDWFESAPFRADVIASRDAGETETGSLAGFLRERRYRVAIVAEDDAGNASPLSNETLTWLGPLALARGLALAPERSPARFPLRIYWQTDVASVSGSRSIRIIDVAGRRVARLPIPARTEGVVTWEGREGGVRLSPGIYFAHLEAAGKLAVARFVVL